MFDERNFKDVKSDIKKELKMGSSNKKVEVR